MSSLRQYFLRNIAQTSPAPLGLEVERASGSTIYAAGGKAYTDLISGICVNAMGHNFPPVIEAIKNQLDKYSHTMVYGEHIQSPQVEYARELVRDLPPELQCVYFVNSGSEAVEGAMKLCRKYTGRTEILAARKAYHGSTQGAESLRSDLPFTRAFRPLVPGIKHLTFNSFAELEKITSSTAGVIMETAQAEAGVILPDPDYFAALRRKCDDTGALLIFDEIQTGYGRSGRLFAFERYGFAPDIFLSAKGLGGGLPLGAIVSSGEIMHSFTENPMLGHITTFGGNPVSCTSGLATLRAIRAGEVMESVETKAVKLREGLLANEAVSAVRNCGLLIAVELADQQSVQRLHQMAFENGVLVDWFLFNERCFRLSPALNISEEDIDSALEVLNNCLDRL